jgi:hypothetical protein
VLGYHIAGFKKFYSMERGNGFRISIKGSGFRIRIELKGNGF